MPIYEFYCGACHMIFNFYTGSVNTLLHGFGQHDQKTELPKMRQTKTGTSDVCLLNASESG